MSFAGFDKGFRKRLTDFISMTPEQQDAHIMKREEEERIAYIKNDLVQRRIELETAQWNYNRAVEAAKELQ